MIIYAKGLGLVSKQRPFKFLDRVSYHYRQSSPYAFSLAPFSWQSLKSVLGESLSVTLQLTVESSGTIYMGKREIPVRKSNGSRHYVWEAS